ncbi:MAG: hypothetical protein ACE5HS_13840, partial [bacterium]
MMRYNKGIGGIVLFLQLQFFIMGLGPANAQSSANYALLKDVLDTAGDPSISTNYKLEDAAGQPSTIGNSASTQYALSAGYLSGSAKEARLQHFTFKANTGDSYSIVVTAATIDGASLESGDEIGVFTPAGLCVGASVWTGAAPLALIAWIDDSQTGDVDGYVIGDSMTFNIWVQSSDTEYAATPTYAQGNGTFGNGAFASVSLTAVTSSATASIKTDAPPSAQCGEEFWVTVVVGDPNPVTNLFGVSIELNYPTMYIDYVAAQTSNPDTGPGNLLGSDLIFIATPDDASGKVSVGVSRKSGTGGVSGSGSIVWMKFISLATTPDPTDVTWSLSNITANDAGGNPLTFASATASTTIQCGCKVWPGDTNNDGVVTAADVLPIGLHFGKTGPTRSGASLSWSGQIVTC